MLNVVEAMLQDMIGAARRWAASVSASTFRAISSATCATRCRAASAGWSMRTWKRNRAASVPQTQQQLGVQALSIANSNSQNLLSLFR